MDLRGLGMDGGVSGSATITISDSAARRIAALTADGENAGKMLRVAVDGGGCSGFQYSFSFDDVAGPEDTVVGHLGVSVVIDDMSRDYLGGAEIHYEEELIGSWFTVRNPNASSTCGCGTSFAIG
jgi:iron-sulfur cluster insertion protein